MILYRTVCGYGEAQQEIEKSKFIAYVKPVSTKDEADAFISEIKKKHKDATHNVPAMVLGDKSEIQWASDDGEPQGTSGAPIVQMLVSEGITNVVVVVTRYFGGIKLGTGGLVRAYTSSAKKGILSANLCIVNEAIALNFNVDYSVFNKIQNSHLKFGAKIVNIVFTDTVTFDIVVEQEYREETVAFIEEISNGAAVITHEETRRVTVSK